MTEYNKKRRDRPIGGLERTFKIILSVYIAALVTPATLFLLRGWLSPEIVTFLFVVLVVAASSSLSIVMNRWQFPFETFNSLWIAALLPIIGSIPLFAYLWPFIMYVSVLSTELSTYTAGQVIGFTGFIAGIVTTCLGGVLANIILKKYHRRHKVLSN